MAENVIIAHRTPQGTWTTPPVYQFASGMLLQIAEAVLPPTYTVEFSSTVTGPSVPQIGGPDGVPVPDEFFVPGSTIHGWLVLTGTNWSVTKIHILIPVPIRAQRTNTEPTPVQQPVIDRLIGAMNAAVSDCQQSAASAAAAKNDAEAIAQNVQELIDALDLGFAVQDGVLVVICEEDDPYA